MKELATGIGRFLVRLPDLLLLLALLLLVALLGTYEL